MALIKKPFLTPIFSLFLGALILPHTAAAQTESGQHPDSWNFEFTPYIFAAGLNGPVGIGPVNAKVDMGFDDILENLDSAFMAMFEAHKGALSFAVDGVYFKLEDERAKSWQGPRGNTGTARLDISVTEQVYQLTAGYRLADDKIQIDVLGVARYTHLDTNSKLSITTGTPLLDDGSFRISGSQSWWDPAIGTRVLMPVAKSWTLIGYADIGGFGAGTDITYQLIAGANWQATPSITAKFGYRYLYQDYEDNNFTWDMTSDGAYLGVGFQF